MSDDVVPEDTPIAVIVQPNAEDFMPEIVVGLPVPGGAPGEYVSCTLDPDEAFSLGAFLVKAAMASYQVTMELTDKTIDQRREIVELYELFSMETEEGPPQESL